MMREEGMLGCFVGFEFTGDVLFEIDRFRSAIISTEEKISGSSRNAHATRNRNGFAISGIRTSGAKNITSLPLRGLAAK